jgi:hypothetical protein
VKDSTASSSSVRSDRNCRFFEILRSHDILIIYLFGLLALVWTGCGGGTTPVRALVSVAVQPANGEATAPTGTSPFTATGTFDQPPTTQDNLSAQWSSSDTTVATIDSNTGTATCVGVGGPVTITALSVEKQGTAQLTCVSSTQVGSGNCAYQCPSTRCGALTGFCSISTGGACRQVYDPGQCELGKPAGGTATDSCGVGIDTTRTCTP